MKYGTVAVIALILTVFITAVYGAPAGVKESPQQALLRELGAKRAIIFNGDDLGRTAWSNEGILKAYREGVISSTTIMVPAPAAADAYKLLSQNKDIDAGIHLVLAQDSMPSGMYAPLTPRDKVPSLVDANGLFPTSIRPLANANKDEVMMELTAQIEDAIAHGVDITHLDCHMGWYHDYNMRTLKPVIALAQKYQLPLRWAGKPNDAILLKAGIVVPDHLNYIDGRTTFEEKKRKLLEYLDNMPEGISEFVVHPATGGYDEVETAWRTGDLKLMLDPDVRAALDKNGIKLIGYKTLRDFQRRMNSKTDGS